jgi:ubiquinone biosynthesis protein
VLTLEEITGISMRNLLGREQPGYDRRELAHRLAEGFLCQYFELGMFHADPHPGNLLVEPPASIGLIDFGLTGRLDDILLSHLVVGLLGAINKEPEVIVGVLADMDALGERTDRQQLRRGFLELIEKYYGLPLHRFDMQTLFYEITDLVRRHDVTLPREFVLFGKSLVGIGGICLQLDPQMDLLGLVKPRLRTIIAQRLKPARMFKAATITGWHLLNLFRNTPGYLRDISRRLAQGKWQVNIRHQNLDYLASEMDRASNRLSFAVIIAAIIMGSSWVLTAGSEVVFFGIPLWAVGVVGYLVAGVMGLWLVVSIVRSGKLS